MGDVFGQVERQKLKTEESSMRLSAAKGRLDRSLNTAEQELQEAQQQILMLQVRIHHKSKRDRLLWTNCGLQEPVWRHHRPLCLL